MLRTACAMSVLTGVFSSFVGARTIIAIITTIIPINTDRANAVTYMFNECCNSIPCTHSRIQQRLAVHPHVRMHHSKMLIKHTATKAQEHLNRPAVLGDGLVVSSSGK